MACGLTHIGRGTASTLKKYTTLDLRYLILKREKRRDLSGGKEKEPEVEMMEGGITKAIDSGADLKRMCPCE